MKIFAELRTLVLLRRIARALEASNRLAETRLAMEHPEWARSERKPRKVSKPVDFGVASADDFNEGWQKLHPETEFAEDA